MLHKLYAHFLCFVFVLLTSRGSTLQPWSAIDEDTTSDSEPATANAETVVRTTKGFVKGLILISAVGNSVRVFYGIPYAEPPVGKLRFSRSKPNSGWSGILDATVKPNSCVQVINNAYGDFVGATKWNANTNMSEDCLKLNVWTPIPPFKEALAVLVWIYGGGFLTGTSTLDMYDARTLAGKEGVIFVSMNYRVASLGFLSFGNEHLPGNAGLYDQHLALEWVRDNIAAFGGDPNRVTLIGESSGAASVGYHFFSPLSRKLFSRVILESVSSLTPRSLQKNNTARKLAARLAGDLGCPQDLDEETLDCLRDKDPSDIVHSETGCGGILHSTFLPVEDGALIPKVSEALIADSSFDRHRNILIGSNLNEANYFLQLFFGFPLTDGYPYTSRENFTTALQSLDPATGVPPFDEVLKMYTGGVVPSTSEGKLKALDSIVSDYLFSCPIVRLADSLVENEVRLYQYVFTRRSSREEWPLWMGVLHSEELAFVFGAPFNSTLHYEEEEKILSDRIMRYWTNFAKTGSPNNPDDRTPVLPVWPQPVTSSGEYIVLDVEQAVGFEYRAAYCDFWASIEDNWTDPIC